MSIPQEHPKPKEERDEPKILSDPRFKGGRELVINANDDGIQMFAILVQEAVHKYGESSIEAACCYYEYGNALFRSANRRKLNDEEVELEKETKLEGKPTLKLNEKKSLSEKIKEKEENKEEEEEEGTDVSDDIKLSLELMESAWAILDEFSTNKSNGSQCNKYQHWLESQLPRYLVGIGDVLSALNKHADAADTYTRALPYREKDVRNKLWNELSCAYLKKRRLYVEVNVLICEELLSCPHSDDIITSETKSILVKKDEILEYIQGYYDKARDELQETVYLMGRMAAKNIDLGTEKEDVCFLSTMLMSVGNSIADLQEKNDEQEIKRQKRN